jgi:hypothetical protein
MNKILFFDESNYRLQKEQYELYIPKIQMVVDLFNTLNIGKLLSAEFERLVNDPVSLVYDKITNGKEIDIAGIKINKVKAMEIIEKPAEYYPLIDNIKTLISEFSSGYSNCIQKINVSKIGTYYELNEDGYVIFSKLWDTEIKNRNTKYATSSEACSMVNFSKDVIELIAKHGLTKSFISNPNGVGKVFESIISISRDKNLQMNVDGIQRYQ